MDLNERLEHARQNAATLKAQRDEITRQLNGVTILLTKWEGVAEYLASLIEMEQKAAQADGKPHPAPTLALVSPAEGGA